MAAKVPFVAVFATPAYCESRTCGPTVEIVEEVRQRVSPTKTRFIHVEVYKDNDPAKGVNKFMTEWNLPSEPWIFVVDSTGIIRERFEGSASVEELEAAVRESASDPWSWHSGRPPRVAVLLSRVAGR